VTQAACGAFFAALVALFAYRANALTAAGAIAAFAVGAIVFGSGGWPAAAVLFAFFLPSTILSRVGADRKRLIAPDARQSARSAWQVVANGGVAALCAFAAPRLGAPFAAAFAGAFAAASADTWGTELGMLSRRPPISILTLRTLRAGVSGGVTPLGLLSSVGGALCVALVAGLARVAPFGAVAAGGIAGAILDSVLGASLQALRWCPGCNCECETRRHHCGAATTLRRGASFLENDSVNFAATLCGAVVASVVAGI
jgi:uncharacterized protein (TIGR00297 family)